VIQCFFFKPLVLGFSGVQNPNLGSSGEEPGRERRPEGVFYLAQVPYDTNIEEILLRRKRLRRLRRLGGLVDYAGLSPMTLFKFVESGLLEHDQAGCEI
jgi:hypothetical protein